MLKIYDIRKEYRQRSLDLKDLDNCPFSQFSLWFEEASLSQIEEFNAMALATASKEGRPSCRNVLLKKIDTSGFSFFTHYDSRKGQELSENPYSCGVFYWKELERQVTIEGRTEKIPPDESAAYFASRPRESQLAAWASKQDSLIVSRKDLEKSFRYFERMYEGKMVPIPPYWGGFHLQPERFEFWQGRPFRLHDRFSYHLREGIWEIERLGP